MLSLECLWAIQKKKKNGKETIGYKGLEINYTICDRVVNLESQACRLKPWESVK